MQKIYLRGYIYYNKRKYIFNFEEKKLVLISIENEITFLERYQYIDYFEGHTLDGFDVVFHIKDKIYFKDGCYICFPRSILVVKEDYLRINELNFDSIKIVGGNINRFYSNKKMIEYNKKEYKKNNINDFVFKQHLNFLYNILDGKMTDAIILDSLILQSEYIITIQLTIRKLFKILQK